MTDFFFYAIRISASGPQCSFLESKRLKRPESAVKRLALQEEGQVQAYTRTGRLVCVGLVAYDGDVLKAYARNIRTPYGTVRKARAT